MLHMKLLQTSQKLAKLAYRFSSLGVILKTVNGLCGQAFQGIYHTLCTEFVSISPMFQPPTKTFFGLIKKSTPNARSVCVEGYQCSYLVGVSLTPQTVIVRFLRVKGDSVHFQYLVNRIINNTFNVSKRTPVCFSFVRQLQTHLLKCLLLFLGNLET